MENDILAVTHRHVIFTIDEGLREIFLLDKYRKKLLKGLMDEAAKILLDFFQKHQLKAGIISTLHTFGSKLEFNPHVHMVVTMGGITSDKKWKEYDYLPFVLLRKYWQNAVLKLIRRTLSEWDKRRVQKRLQAAYEKNGDGFYIHAPKRSRVKLRGLLEYISRYMKRGPIALERILMYDGDQVMFQYHDKRTNQKETETMTVERFIGALIRHISDHYFHTVRRYGIYARRIKTLMREIAKACQKQKKRMLVNVKEALKPLSWAERMNEAFGENPLECSRCGEHYEFMGMSVRKKGRLRIQYAKDEQAMTFMREENRKIEQETFQVKYQDAKQKVYEAVRFDWERQRQLYLSRMWEDGGYSNGGR